MFFNKKSNFLNKNYFVIIRDILFEDRILVLRIENSTVNDNSGQPVKTIVQQEQKQDVIPVGQTEKAKTDTEAPVEGYYIEKTGQTPQNDDDKLDTSINPDARITINPSIAIYKETDEISDAMKQTVDRAVANIFHDSGADSYFKATDMIKNEQPYNCFDDITFAKKFNVYGKAVYEAVNYSYTTNIPSRVERQENSIKTDLGLNYKSKFENTKAMLYSSFTKTNTKTSFDAMSSEDSEMPQGKIESNYKSYSLFGVLQQRFKNKDLGTISAYHINDEIQEAKTSNITASYFLNKYIALAQGSLNTYKVLNQKAITKLDFNISLNPELAFPELKAKEAPEQEAEQNTETKVVQEANTKKWSKSFSPFFDTQSINGNTEEGIGGQMRFKRTGNTSTFRVDAFGKVSTTQQEENNQYHVTFGSGVKYRKNFNSQSQLNASVDLKDRITFGGGNIATANATVSYTSPKITAEVEGKYINITHSDSPDYAGVVGRVFYTPNKNLNLFAEASYTDMKEPNSRTSGSNIQAGVIVNF